MFLGNDRLLDGIHTADRGAIGIVATLEIAGAHALKPCDLFRFLSVRRSDHMAARGTAGGQDSFEFDAGHYIGEIGIPVALHGGRIVRLQAGRENHRAHMERDLFFRVIELDGAGRTEFLACPALALLEINAVIPVNHVFQGNRLGVGDVYGLSLSEVLVIGVIHFPGAFFKTGPAGDALVHVYVSGMFFHGDGEVTFLSLDSQYFRKGEQLDIEVPADLDQFG
jgi:hypothetical protein